MLCRFSLATLITTATTIVAAQTFPDKPVRVVVPYPAGGPVDFIARAIQPAMQDVWGQPVIIDNRGGASGMVGSAAVSKSKPDGYTLLLGSVQTHAMNPGVIKSMMYDPFKDFTPITQTTRANWMLVASPKAGVKSPAEWATLVRSRADKLTFGSSGNGSAGHLGFSMLAQALGVSLTHVPYKGTMQAVSDVLAGQIDFVMSDQSTVIPQINAGKLVAIAMTGNARSSLLPNVPTVAETLVPGFDVQAWQGIWGPPGMDAALAQSINASIAKAVKQPAVLERLRASGIDVVGSSAADFDKMIRVEHERWTGAAAKANIKPE